MRAVAALGLCLWTAHRLAARWSTPDAGRAERWCATAAFLPVVGISTVRVLAGLGLLRPGEILAVFACQAILAGVVSTTRLADRHPLPTFEPAAALPLGVGALTVAIALVAAVGLPIWQWDSLGYHLPFVAFALQAGSLAGVPWQVPYIGSYPHAVELWDLGARALLSGDRWLDAAQLPLALCGAVALAGLARRLKTPPATSAGLGALWLCLPAVFLQLPSAYVDVASAAFFLLAFFWVLAAPTFRSAVLAGLALGLFLDSKPTAPVPALILGLGFAAHAWRAKRPWLPLVTVACAVALGAETYLANIAAHGNPLWPVRLDLGPLHLPGLGTPGDLLASGAAAPHLTGSLPARLARSWTAIDPLPAFDMRVGGFGPLFLLVALPLGLIGAARRGGMWLVGLGAALATPDPTIARFTLPFPALLLALAGGELARWRPAMRSAATGLAAALAGLGLWLALPGLAAGHSLLEVLRWSPASRAAALLPPANADRWVQLRAALTPGTTVALDRAFDLPYLLWRPDLQNRVEVVPDGIEGQPLLDWFESKGISLLVAGRSKPGGQLAEAHSERWAPLFACGASEAECEVYAARPLSPTFRRLASPPDPVLAPEPGSPRAADPSP